MNRKHYFTGIATICVIAMASTLTTTAETYNSQLSFEEFGPGTAIVDHNGSGILGFTGSPADNSQNAGEIVAETPAEPANGYPIVDATHTSVVAVVGSVARNYDAENNSATNYVYVDTMIQAGKLMTQPAVPAGAQVAAYVNGSGQLVVRHGVYTNLASDCDAITRHWTELAHTALTTGEWARLTIVLNYIDAGSLFNADEHYFSIALNGQQLTHKLAYGSLPLDTLDCNAPVASANNKWFGMADSLYGSGTGENSPNNQYFSSVEYSGIGSFDELVVTGSASLVITTSTSSTTGVGGGPSLYDTYIAQFGLGAGQQGAGDDPDGDGASNEEEWNAGTNPNDANDVFEITVIARSSTGTDITWSYGTNSTIDTPFSVWRATNLNEIVYEIIASGIAREADGDSTYTDNDVVMQGDDPNYRVVIDPITNP